MADPSVYELARIARWNKIIPKCAMDVKVHDTHVTYMHPTKGKRYVHKRRLGVQTNG